MESGNEHAALPHTFFIKNILLGVIQHPIFKEKIRDKHSLKMEGAGGCSKAFNKLCDVIAV